MFDKIKSACTGVVGVAVALTAVVAVTVVVYQKVQGGKE